MNSGTTPLKDQFTSLDQQYETSKLGMWVFLVTEILFFGGLFAGYALYRTLYPEAFGLANAHLDVFLGATNTVVLITSSLTMALAVNEARQGKKAGTVRFLALTILLGLVFLGVKFYEYHVKFVEHLVPGRTFSFPEYPGPGAQLFFSFYFAMTGLHALHMIVGIVLLTLLAHSAACGKFSAAYNTPVDMTGLYWHFVDIVWIFLFPLLYLIGRHG